MTKKKRVEVAICLSNEETFVYSFLGVQVSS